MVDALKEDDPNALLDALKNLKKTVRDMEKAPVKDEPNYLAGRNIHLNLFVFYSFCFDTILYIAKAIEDLEKQLANKGKPSPEAKKAFEKAASDPKAQPKPNPTNEVLSGIFNLL